jgi:hypothetical protein
VRELGRHQEHATRTYEEEERREEHTLDMAKPRPILPMPVERAHLREGSRKNLLRAIQGAP